MAVSIEEVTAEIAPLPAEKQEPVVIAMPVPFDPEPVMRLLRREHSRIERRCAH